MRISIGLMLLVAFGFAACSKTSVGGYVPIESNADVISQKWALSRYYRNNSPDSVENWTDSTFIAFSKDRNFYIKTKDVPDSLYGNWFFSNEVKKLNLLNFGDTITYDINMLNSTSLQISTMAQDTNSQGDTIDIPLDYFYIPYKEN